MTNAIEALEALFIVGVVVRWKRRILKRRRKLQQQRQQEQRRLVKRLISDVLFVVGIFFVGSLSLCAQKEGPGAKAAAGAEEGSCEKG